VAIKGEPSLVLDHISYRILKDRYFKRPGNPCLHIFACLFSVYLYTYFRPVLGPT